MNKEKTIVYLEATSRGCGLGFLDASIDAGKKTVFLTKNFKKYKNDVYFKKIKDRCEIIIIDTKNLQLLHNKISELSRIRDLEAIISMSDGFIETASLLSEDFGLRCTNPEFLNVCRDKYKFRKVCQNLNIESTKYSEINNFKDLEHFFSSNQNSIVLKPSKGTGSICVRYCGNQADLARYFEELELHCQSTGCNILAEGFIPGRLYSAEIIVANREIRFLGFTNRILAEFPNFVEIADAFPFFLPKAQSEQFYSVIKTFLKSFDKLYAVLHVEFIVNGNNVSLVEINPRLGGGFIGLMISDSYGSSIYRAVNKLYTDGNIQFPHKSISGAAEFFFYSNNFGKIKKINGIDLIKKINEIKDSQFYIKEGDTLDQPKDFKGAFGHVYAVAKTAIDALGACQTASSYVNIEID